MLLTDNGLNAARCVDKNIYSFDLLLNCWGCHESDADKAACGMEHGMTSRCQKMSALMNALSRINL